MKAKNRKIRRKLISNEVYAGLNVLIYEVMEFTTRSIDYFNYYDSRKMSTCWYCIVYDSVRKSSRWTGNASTRATLNARWWTLRSCFPYILNVLFDCSLNTRRALWALHHQVLLLSRSRQMLCRKFHLRIFDMCECHRIYQLINSLSVFSILYFAKSHNCLL